LIAAEFAEEKSRTTKDILDIAEKKFMICNHINRYFYQYKKQHILMHKT
jgi:hypothetical protein